MFIGRKKELEELFNVLNSEYGYGKIVGIKGRRRVGKSTLVYQFSQEAKHKNHVFYLNFIGNKNLSSKDNLKQVVKSLISQIENKNFFKFLKIRKTDVQDWNDFFNIIHKICWFLENENTKLILFLDEICWFSKKDNFYNDFANNWNSKLVNQKNLLVIFAGSSVSWLNNKFFNNVEIFYGRIDKTIDLKPFSLKEIYFYLKQFQIPDEDIILYYLMFGGIIKYYSFLNFNLNFEKNLENLFKEKFKELKKEKEILYDALFSCNRSHSAIIEQLSSSKSLTYDELFLKIKQINKNIYKNIIYEDMVNLIANDLCLEDQEIYNKKCIINDLFSFFFFYWFGKDEKYKKFSLDNGDYRTWKGIALEILTFNHFDLFNLKKYSDEFLSLNVSLFNNQYDLISNTKDNTYLNIIECKNYKEQLILSYSDLENFENKIKNFTQREKFLTLVSIKGSKISKNIKENSNWLKHFSIIEWLNS